MNANLQTVEIVVPVHNEAPTLAASVDALLAYLHSEFPFHFAVVVADNASTDETPEVATRLAERYSEVSALRLEQKGRGLALRSAWLASGADELERVFERFFRADPSRSRASGGVGLGLAIVAAVAEAHGGSVDASSEPGCGATFRITLPLASENS